MHRTPRFAFPGKGSGGKSLEAGNKKGKLLLPILMENDIICKKAVSAPSSYE